MIETKRLSKQLASKYTKILQVDTSNHRPSAGSISVHGSPISSDQTGILEKLALTQKNPDRSLSLHRRTLSQHSTLIVSTPKVNSTSRFRFDFSNTTPHRTSNENLFQSFSPADKFIKKMDELRVPRFNSEGFINLSQNRSQKDTPETMSVTSTGNNNHTKSKSIFIPLNDKVLTFEDLYKESKDFGEELNLIMSQDSEKLLKDSIQYFKVGEFIEIQRSRISNLMKIIEKAYVPKESKESKFKQDVWQVVSAEMNKMRSMYEKFLCVLKKTLEKLSKGANKVYDIIKPWEALKLVLEYSSQSRQDNRDDTLRFDDSEEIMQKIFQFKVDYRTSKDFNPKILEIYELVEAHVKELNQIIEDERERHNLVMQQQKKIIQEHSEQEKKQDLLKEEMVSIIREIKKNEGKQVELKGLEFEHMNCKRLIGELQEEKLKLFEDNTRLKKTIKDLRAEVKRLSLLEQKNIPKRFHDQGVMVDLYSEKLHIAKHVEPPSGLSAYIKDQSLCIDATELPKGLSTTMINLIFSDKMITDACDDYEIRPRKPLSAYVTEWFLKRFGLYDFCKIIIKDFVYSLERSEAGGRGKVFSDLLGNKEESSTEAFRFTIDSYSHLDKTKLRKAVLGTSKMLDHFFKIINCIKAAYGANQNSLFQQQSYGPYLINTELVKGSMDADVARIALYRICKQNNFTEEEVKEAEEYLEARIQKELFENERAPETEENTEEKTEPAPVFSINVDVFIKFALEAVMEKELRSFEMYYTSIKARVSVQRSGKISYDEYAAGVETVNPKASRAWKDHSFARLIGEQPGNDLPLYILIENLVGSFLHEDRARNLFYKGQMEGDLKSPKNSDNSNQRGSKLKPKKSMVTRASVVIPQLIAQTPKPTNPKQKLIAASKGYFKLGNPVLNEIGYEYYDCVSSLIVLQEVYGLVNNSIDRAEMEDHNVKPIHDAFIRDLAILPQQLMNIEKLEALFEFTKEELVDILEYLWTQLRSLIVLSFREKY